MTVSSTIPLFSVGGSVGAWSVLEILLGIDDRLAALYGRQRGAWSVLEFCLESMTLSLF